jgi:DNA polymerase III subunit beta
MAATATEKKAIKQQAGPVLSCMVNAKALTDALTQAARFLPSRPHIPVFSGVWLEVQNGWLTISLFDLETRFDTAIPLSPHGVAFHQVDGRVLVPGRLLASTAKKALSACGVAELSADDKRISLSPADTTRAQVTRVALIDPTDAPDMPPKVGKWPVATLPHKALEAIAAVGEAAAGRDDTLPALTGVQIAFSTDGIVTAVATDRYRMAITEQPAAVVTDTFVLTPRSALTMATRFLGDTSIEVSGELGDNAVLESFVMQGSLESSVRVRPIEGEFPKWKSIFPSPDAGSAWFIDRPSLVHAVQTVLPTVEKNCPIKLVLWGSGIEISGGSKEDGAESSVSLDTARSFGADGGFTTACNPQYLLDGLALFDGPLVQIQLTDNGKPMMWSDPQNGRTRYLLMPVRLGS